MENCLDFNKVSNCTKCMHLKEQKKPAPTLYHVIMFSDCHCIMLPRINMQENLPLSFRTHFLFLNNLEPILSATTIFSQW